MVKHTRTTLAAAVGTAAACAIALATPAFATSAHGRDSGKSTDPAKAVSVVTESIPPLAVIGGVRISGSAYGSAWTPAPGRPGYFYGLTDRGPNVTAPNGTDKVEPLPSFDPAIGLFHVTGSKATLLKKIPLEAADGSHYNGLVSTEADTGERIFDLSGNLLPKSDFGFDPEGLVALPDGTFWISDEYGPYIRHFGADGHEIDGLSPYNGTLPEELRTREPNKGMEGLTITPDGKTLVGIMQSGLDAPGGPKSAKLAALRVVTVSLEDWTTHEYVYVMPVSTGNTEKLAASEITALSNTTFLVDLRDGAFEPGANKKLWKIDLSHATDVGPSSPLIGHNGVTYDGGAGGLLVNGKPLEVVVADGSAAAATSALTGAGVTPVSSSLFLDVAGLVSAISPTGAVFGHDKVEGVSVLEGGKKVVLSNDSDFGITDLPADATPPYALTAKILPNGTQDAGELLVVDMTKVPAQFR